MTTTAQLQIQSVEGFRLSPQQRRLWRLTERHPEVSFATQAQVAIRGPLNVDRLEKAILALRKTHEILRTRFVCLPGTRVPVQVINDEIFGLNQRLSIRNEAAVEAEVESMAADLWRQAGEAGNDQGVNFTLLTVTDTEHILLITSSGLCADAPALAAIVRQVRDAYAGSLPSDSESIQYADISEWQNQLLEGDAKEHDSYWKASGFSELRFPRLPFELRHSEVADFNPGVLVRDVSLKIPDGLQPAEVQSASAAQAFLIAAYQVLVGLVSGSGQFLLGVRVDGRTPAELRDAIGLFAKSMPVVAALEPQQTFLELVQNVSRTVELARYDQAFFDLESFASAASARSSAVPLLFTTYPSVAIEPIQSTQWQIIRLEECLEPFELSVSATIADGLLNTLKFTWDRSVFSEREIAMLAGYYRDVLRQVVANPNLTVSELNLGSAAVLMPSAPAALEQKEPCGVHEWIEDQCARVPQNVAVICGNQQLTYAQLNQRASQLAHRLVKAGAGPDTVIAILAQRSVDFIIAIFAVLKSGAAWLPIDPETPPERIKYMLGRAAAIAVITETVMKSAVEGIEIPVIQMDELTATDSEMTTARAKVLPEQLAYVIFTSGSTGRPKGVAIEHRQFIAYLRGFKAELNLPEKSSCALVSTMAADLGHTPVFAALTSGGCVHVVPPAFSSDVPALAKYFLENAVDCIKIVPAHLEALCQSFPEKANLPWRAAILGGEPLTWELTQTVKKFAPRCAVVNEYGPTETTVGVISGSAELGREEFNTAEATIGTPRAGVAAYVLDQDLRPMPAWIAGDLYIGGSSVGRGYIGTADLTAERFIPDPFLSTPGSRMYVTGDRARYRSDGTFEFLGRRDGQIKLRGYRIELGEIEATLCRHPQVQTAVVTLIQDKTGDKSLAAWAAVGQTKLQPQELRRFALESLPSYMVPNFFTCVERLKLTPNGKVDRQALPPVAEQQSAKPGIPLDEVEESLLAAWRKVLGKESISVDDNYFSLGGDSLRVVQVVHEARRYGIAIRAMDILRHQTIRNLRKALQQERRGELFPNGIPELASVTPANPGLLPPDAVDWYQLSEVQSFVLEKYAANKDADGIYHIQECFNLEDPGFSPQALEAAFKTVVNRHPALRTVLYLKSSPPLQCVRSALSWKVDTVDISHLDGAAQETDIAEAMRADRAHLFDPDNHDVPLFRVAIFLRSGSRFSLLFSCHHAIMDGWGHRTFLNQLVDAYAKLKSGERADLGEPDNVCHQFVAFEKAVCHSDQVAQFWRSYLSLSSAQFPSLPEFAAKPAEETDDRAVAAEFTLEQTQALQRMAQENAVSMQALLLAAWLEALRKWSGEPLASTGVISNGRSEYLSDPLSAVGLFWNIVPVISREKLPLAHLGAAVQKDLVAIQPYSSYSLPRLMSDNAGKELFYSVFKYLNFWNTQDIPQESGLRLLGASAVDRYPFALSCSAILDYSGLHIEIELDPGKTFMQPVKRLLDFYRNVIEEIHFDRRDRA